ncbi:MAG: DUF6245 family protein [Pseudonocardiaceae bacterium]
MSLARAQVLKAGRGGGHPNAAVGMLHWQAGQIAQPLRALARTHDLGPILGAAAHTAQALLALLTLCAVADPDDARGLEPLALLTDAQTALDDAGADLERIHDWVTELAASLHRQQTLGARWSTPTSASHAPRTTLVSGSRPGHEHYRGDRVTVERSPELSEHLPEVTDGTVADRLRGRWFVGAGTEREADQQTAGGLVGSWAVRDCGSRLATVRDGASLG